MDKYLTIRQVAAAGILPEYCLRRRLKCGQLPVIRSGARNYVNVEVLLSQLEMESVNNMQSEEA